MSKWIDHLALWQFTLFNFGAMFLAVVVGGIGLENLMGRADVIRVVGVGAVSSAGRRPTEGPATTDVRRGSAS
jgi:hypothetical protein